MTRLIRWFPIASVLALSACGSNGDRVPTYAVSGKVLVNGKPAEHASVVLHPLNATDNTPKPHGKVGPDGTFTLTTYDGNDGAPAGDYRVTVELWLASNRPDEGPTSRLPAKFANPDLSGLKATVGTGPTTLNPIEIKKVN